MDMSVKRLRRDLERLGFAERDYAIGKSSEDKICVIKEGDGWAVFYVERGKRCDEVSFDSETVACTYMLGLFAEGIARRAIRGIEYK